MPSTTVRRSPQKLMPLADTESPVGPQTRTEVLSMPSPSALTVKVRLLTKMVVVVPGFHPPTMMSRSAHGIVVVVVDVVVDVVVGVTVVVGATVVVVSGTTVVVLLVGGGTMMTSGGGVRTVVVVDVVDVVPICARAAGPKKMARIAIRLAVDVYLFNDPPRIGCGGTDG